jgi:hypothetical protein
MYKLILLAVFILIGQTLFAQEKNVAVNKPVMANSENSSFPAGNAVDGKITRRSKWMSGNVKPPHILEIDLQKYCDISRIVVHTGIPETELTASEASQAAGFWSAKNFKLYYWDDANWTDIPNTEVHENRLTTVSFTFPSVLNTFKLRFVCDDGEPISIMEIEVFGTETDRILAGSATSLQKKTERVADQDVTVTIADKVVGKSMKYVGYNQGYYMPGSNVSGWIEYSGVNSLRVWTSLNSYVPVNTIQVDENIRDVQEFDKRKATLRLNPEKNIFIRWENLLPIYTNTEKAFNTNPMVLSYVLAELKRLKIDPILQINSTDFNDTWSTKWQQWQRYYALAYYAARVGDVSMFAMQNEPNHKASGPMKLDQWIGGMQIVSDALKCALEDVNKKYGKNLKARMVGPVTAGNNTEWWAVVAKNIRTDYHGKPMDEDLLGIFSTHSYNSPAAGYESRVSTIRNILTENHPAGKALPIVLTEIGRWMNAYLIDKEETMDSPSLFTEWAGIYTNNTRNGAYGMWAFKFSNTVSDVYKSGVKSGHHFTWQGKRIVEDAYINLAKNKPVKASNEAPKWTPDRVVDGDKSDQSAWHSDSTASQKWIEIDLGEEKTLGSAVVYTGSASGTYTAPDRVRNFSLQYQSNGDWKDIPGFSEKENKYAQVYRIFKQPVTTSKVRFVSDDAGLIKVREIKVFAKDDGPADEEMNYDVSGIQRTGEVVRLFAKGFKDERPLYETSTSVKDENLDVLATVDATSGNYYLWLVQRGSYNNKLTIDLSVFDVQPGSPVTAEMVSPDYYGELTQLISIPESRKLNYTLPPQSVVLLTIPKGKLTKTTLEASADATVVGGENAGKNYGAKKQLLVRLDAAQPENNKVACIYFDLTNQPAREAQRIVLTVNGYTGNENRSYRLHVYGIPSEKWDQKKLNWTNTPLLNAKEALIKEVGQKAFVAGELAFSNRPQNHMLDVTDLVKKHGGKGITFVLIRETRQLGDDEDKGREVIIGSKESENSSKLIFWQ